MKKILLTFLLLVFSFCGAFAANAKVAAIKVGAIYNLTGAQASLDGPSLNGFNLAAKQINAAGGVLGKKIQVVSLDGKTDQATATNAALKLVNVDKVVIIAGFSDSNYALAAGPIAQKAKIPFITSGATLPTLPELVGDYFFMTPFGDDAQAYVGAEFAVKELKAKTAYVLKDIAMDFTMNLATFFETRFKKINGNSAVLLEDTFKTGDQDFSAQVNRLKAMPKKPGILFISSGPSECGIIVKQIRAAGINTPIISGDGFDTPLLTELGGKGANIATYFATHTCLTSTLPKVKQFVQAYKKEYRTNPENAFAALGYDTMYLIADAIKRAKSTNSTAIRNALAKTNGLKAVTGTISYVAGKRVPKKSVSVLKVTDGQFKFVKEVTP
jgi:branched-chain amino acid transport system substrate-binding protein